MKKMYVYILSNEKSGTLYIGVTNDLIRRIYEYKNELIDDFTKTHNLKKLVYYEIFEDEMNAIQREKNLKRWNRNWKKDLIESTNPDWEDLYEGLIG